MKFSHLTGLFFQEQSLIMLKLKAVRPEWVTLFASAFLLLGFNLVLWQHLFEITAADGKGIAMRVAFGVMILAAFNIVLTIFAFRPLLKPLLTLLFLVSAGVAYFMSQYGVMIDAGMLRNFAETNATEVRDLLSLKLFAYILLLGVLPCLLLWKVPVNYRRWHRELFSKVIVSVASAAVIGVVALANYQGLSSLFRNHHEIRLMLVPSNYIGASIGYLQEQVVSAQQPFIKIGEDAQRNPDLQLQPRKSLTVLVVGESARAQNFGILGYDRDTTPQLDKEAGLIAFTDVHSCGTETAVSVPCMFSNMGRKDYNASKARNEEGLLDVLKRAGIDVIWRDNQSGCKGVCDGLEVQRQEEEEAELAGHAEEVGKVAGDEAPVKDDVAGGEGVRGEADLDEDEEGEEEGREGEGEDGDEVRPAEVGAGVEADEEGDDSDDEDEGAEEVDFADLLEPVGLVGTRDVEDEVDGQPGDGAEGCLGEEGPMGGH